MARISATATPPSHGLLSVVVMVLLTISSTTAFSSRINIARLPTSSKIASSTKVVARSQKRMPESMPFRTIELSMSSSTEDEVAKLRAAASKAREEVERLQKVSEDRWF
jgi:hypothetical protein